MDRKTGRRRVPSTKNITITLLVPEVVFVDVVVVVVCLFACLFACLFVCLPVCLFAFVCFFSNKYIFKSVTAKNQIKANQTIN